MQTPYAHLLRFILRFILVQDYSAVLQQKKKRAAYGISTITQTALFCTALTKCVIF